MRERSIHLSCAASLTGCCCMIAQTSFKRSEAVKIMDEILKAKMVFAEERDKKDRLSYQYMQDDAAEIVQEIVAECQKAVVGAKLSRGPPCSCQPLTKIAAIVRRYSAKMRENNDDQPPRYKLAFQASFGENLGQMTRSASRCLWDEKHDNCAHASWTNAKVYVVVMCFALYYE